MMLIAAVIAGVSETLLGYSIIRQRGLLDPDNYMRIVRIRDGLKAGWFTHIVAADNGGAGTIVYWSHVIDAAVLLLRLPLTLVTDRQSALLYAAAATGPLVAALLAAALVWAAAPLVQPRWLLLAPLVAILSPHVLVFGMFGYVHHHLPLALISLLGAACAGRATAGRAVPGFWCGISAGTGVWISPEALPYALMGIGSIGVAWCVRPSAMARPLALCGMAFAAVTTTAVLVDPPYGGRLSP
jgi:hypothetical protein